MGTAYWSREESDSGACNKLPPDRPAPLMSTLSAQHEGARGPHYPRSSAFPISSILSSSAIPSKPNWYPQTSRVMASLEEIEEKR